MPLTTATLVRGIIDADTSIDLTPFIATADMMVNRLVATAKDSNGNDFYTSDETELIERWLSAHFYATFDPRTAFEQAGSVSQKTESSVDLNLNNSQYGQAAMLLDIAGGLAAWNRKIQKGPLRISCRLTWLGTDPFPFDEVLA